MVFTTHGMEPIGDLGQVGGESWQPITRPLATLYGVRTADYFYDNGDGPTLRVTTRSGYRVEGTPNHPLLVRGGDGRLQFRRLGELRSGDEVAIRLGAQVFGSSTKLHVEGVGMPSLHDPARAPEELEPELARLLGLLLDGGRISPGGDGIVFVVARRRARRGGAPARAGGAVPASSSRSAPVRSASAGVRAARASRRSWRASGSRRDGLRAASRHASTEHRGCSSRSSCAACSGAWSTHRCSRTPSARCVAHLQLMLANFGIESTIAPSDRGWSLRASAEPAQLRRRRLGGAAPAHRTTRTTDRHGRPAPPRRRAAGGAARSPSATASATSDAASAASERAARRARRERAQRGRRRLRHDRRRRAGRAPGEDEAASYRRGSATLGRSSRRCACRTPGRVQCRSSVTVAEVEPVERGRALVREASHDHRAARRAQRAVAAAARRDGGARVGAGRLDRARSRAHRRRQRPGRAHVHRQRHRLPQHDARERRGERARLDDAGHQRSGAREEGGRRGDPDVARARTTCCSSTRSTA